jgi:hypothetical protein
MPDSTKTTAGAEHPAEPRTWKLTPLGAMTMVSRIEDGKEVTGFGPAPWTTVEVIEREPVLKLVQGLRDMPPKGSRRNRIRDEAAAFLTAHRRQP